MSPTLALVVESKIDSGFGPDQIARYVEWLAEVHGARAQRALMTLTAHRPPDSWAEGSEREHALDLGVTPVARLWEELHATLDPLASDPDRDPLSARLIHEFLDMLTEEDLVPTKPLTPDEMPLWNEAAGTIRRFHAYFRACIPAIADALGAPATNAWSSHLEYTYQEFRFQDGRNIAVGISGADDGQVPSRSLRRRAPIFWIQVDARDRRDWDSISDRLQRSVPDDWTPWRPAGRLRIWRYLDELVAAGSFEEQAAQIVGASRLGLAWLDEALAVREQV